MLDESIPLTGLMHYAYCPRRFALLHQKHEWAETTFAPTGQQEAEQAYGNDGSERVVIKTLRSLPLVSYEHGFAGMADMVEILSDSSPRPVAYQCSKTPQPERGQYAEEVQLCAQALCLEEAFGVHIPTGYVYYAASHTRREVAFTPELRQAVLAARDGVRDLQSTQVLPPPAADERCPFCSLQDECQPFAPREFQITCVRDKDTRTPMMEDGSGLRPDR